MRELVFCSRCRGMEVGWNRPYLRHRLTCTSVRLRPVRFPIAVAVVIAAVLSLPTGALAPVIPDVPVRETPATLQEVEAAEEVPASDPTVAAIQDLLARHTRVASPGRLRIARAVVESARTHDVDPFLVTGILIAESSGNPYAISSRQAVGIMQIHVPTWGALAEDEGLNLFLLEDNIYLGARILKDYTRRYGLWTGVMRYLGASQPTAEAQAYVQRVQGIYTDRQAD
jgi:soluble lytic murein transglycosylase-like protein